MNRYKIKLLNGRVLGPLDLDRIKLLILKNRVQGTELARSYPDGDWLPMHEFPELAELLIAKLESRLLPPENTLADQPPESNGPTATVPVTPTLAVPGKGGGGASRTLPADQEAATRIEKPPEYEPPTGELTVISDSQPPMPPDPQAVALAAEERRQEQEERFRESRSAIAREATIVLERPGRGKRRGAKKEENGTLKLLAIVAAVAMIAWELFFGDDPTGARAKPMLIRARLPSYTEGAAADPQTSGRLYQEALKPYLQDTVSGYKAAAEKLLQSLSRDIDNTRALAMLASCYVNLIDSTPKDENYFAVISKLLDMARAKAVDLPETVIADVEFYVTVNKPDAGQERIVEYTKRNTQFDLSLFYYLAYAFHARGDYQNAARYLSQIPDSKVFSPKVFYLRGLIAEALGDADSAIREYLRAIQFQPTHAKSRLRVSDVLSRKGRLKEGAVHVDYLVAHPQLLPPKELARAYYLHSQLNQILQKWDLALGDIERANKLDKDNSDYLLELFTLRARAGDNLQNVQQEARMYFFLGEGEKLRKQGKYQEALTTYLQARQANDRSPIPLVKIGDMFYQLSDYVNARENFRLASLRADKDVAVWAKYINVLIQSYEWEEADRAMKKFRALGIGASSLDKLAGDMYARQGRHTEAQTYYRRSMGRDTIDSDVYIAFARSLATVKDCKNAPFFYALALRFDPLNVDAIVGTAKCVASSQSIDKGISMLQDELQKASGARAELLAAIAELQIQKGEWVAAQQYAEQAMKANPEYALPWKVMAQVHMNREGLDKGALDKALAAYKSYSDRNKSDPSGYLERYRVFIKKGEFQKAEEELTAIYGLYPRYPNLHYYRGTLYSIMGNHQVAVEEFKSELTNNPRSVSALVALGKAYIDMDSCREAAELMSKAMQMAPQSAEPRLQACKAALCTKSYPVAVALCRGALNLDQGNPDIYRTLGKVYRESGDGAGAREMFKKYIEMEPDAPDRAEYERFL